MDERETTPPPPTPSPACGLLARRALSVLPPALTCHGVAGEVYGPGGGGGGGIRG